jgi:hypothetical protein
MLGVNLRVPGHDESGGTTMAQGGGSSSWWNTLPGILTAAAAFITALTGLIIGLNHVGVLPVTTKPVATASENQTPASTSNVSQIPTSATELCSAQNATWGSKTCGSTTIVFQPVYSGNDSAIITKNVGDRPIWIKITPICSNAPQCGKEWTHVVENVSDAANDSKNENLTINEQGVHTFSWVAYR